MSYINLLDIIYPIGSVYMSFEPTSPSEVVGGNWTAIENKVIRGSDNITTGGNDKITHAHWQTLGFDDNACIYIASANDWKICVGGEFLGSTTVNSAIKRGLFRTNDFVNGSIRRDSTSAATFNQLPAYQNLYIWHRVS